MTTAPSQRPGWSPAVRTHVHRSAQGPQALGGPLSSHLPSLPGDAFFNGKVRTITSALEYLLIIS